MSVTIVLGTRPEILKFVSVIEELKRKSMDFTVLYTGQHYDYEMSQRFLEDFRIEPDIFLEVGAGSQGEQTGQMLARIEKQLARKKPNLTLVEGDTNSSLAGALASAKLQIPVGHVEAGCRSFEFYMPEEINRKLIDHCSELLFAPTPNAYDNLKAEGISNRAHIVGSTLTDVCTKIRKSFSSRDEKFRSTIGLIQGELYAMTTIHRRENIEDEKKLTEIMEALMSLPIKVVFPLHPHTSKKLREFGLLRKLKSYTHLIFTEPLGYQNFLYLLTHARLVITDSGGVQEEASIVNTPCITVRNRTEWPETIEAGKNVLVGTQKTKIINYANKIISDKGFYRSVKEKESPFKSGAGIKIVEISQKFLNEKQLK